MRFITTLSSLFFVSSAFSFSLYNNLSRFSKRDETGISSECLNEIQTSKDYLECYGPKITMSNHKEICNAFDSEKCQKILNDPYIALPKCKEDQFFAENVLTPIAIKLNIHTAQLVCSYDSNGNLCPAAETVINGLTINEQVIDNTCKSKKCSDGVRQYLEFMVNNIEELESGGNVKSKGFNGSVSAGTIYNILLTRLNDKQCTSQNDDGKDSSNAEIVKITYLLSIIITLILISLL